MSIYRMAAKSDLSQQAIIAGLRTAGIRVFVIRIPCDLLCYFWCNRHRDYCWQTLECKSPFGKSGNPRQRKDQETQKQFLADTQTPVATNFDQAWAALNTRHRLGSVSVPCVLNPT